MSALHAPQVAEDDPLPERSVSLYRYFNPLTGKPWSNQKEKTA
ncbi:MAG: hypothetical protein V7679_00620 [Parasphingorhabdus sp.]